MQELTIIEQMSVSGGGSCTYYNCGGLEGACPTDLRLAYCSTINRMNSSSSSECASNCGNNICYTFSDDTSSWWEKYGVSVIIRASAK